MPSGIKHVEGVFQEGDVVEVATPDGKVFMKAVPYFNSTDLTIVQGHKSSDIEKLLGSGRKDVVFRPEDVAVVSEDEQV